MLLLVTALITLGIDQSSKTIIKYLLTEGESIAVLPNVFHLTYVLNPGAAFGLFAHKTTFFVVVTLVALILIAIMVRHIQRREKIYMLSLGLILGGIAGNFIDRLRGGLVVDFLDFRIWPVFNLADTAIVIGAFFFVLQVGRKNSVS